MTKETLKEVANDTLRKLSGQIAIMEDELDTAHRIHTVVSELCDIVNNSKAVPVFTKTIKTPKIPDMVPWETAKVRAKIKKVASKKTGKSTKRKYTKKSSYWKRKG